jgi:hypothetical protein
MVEICEEQVEMVEQLGYEEWGVEPSVIPRERKRECDESRRSAHDLGN